MSVRLHMVQCLFTPANFGQSSGAVLAREEVFRAAVNLVVWVTVCEPSLLTRE